MSSTNERGVSSLRPRAGLVALAGAAAMLVGLLPFAGVQREDFLGVPGAVGALVAVVAALVAGMWVGALVAIVGWAVLAHIKG